MPIPTIGRLLFLWADPFWYRILLTPNDMLPRIYFQRHVNESGVGTRS
jgi:hypothetical protein